MSEMKVSDLCTCGAAFECEGSEIYVSYRHEAWLKAHARCRTLCDEPPVEAPTRNFPRVDKTPPMPKVKPPNRSQEAIA